ncbi:MAG TPA: cysteine--tRNA ligase [Candidatus Nanoarchaeia archaeon]|nr:cysteine--tRNA ligase [Candidatus Nanoarchaeia archaeon]
MRKDAPLYLYNTLTREKEIFKPIKKGSAGMYSCGPTVYDYAHIGNMRSYVFSDILKRVLVYNGLKVKHVMNVTDVGHLESDGDVGADKMELAVRKEHKTAQDIADYYLSVFKQDMEKLHISEPSVWCKATEHIKEQIELIKKLGKKGYTYRTNDGIYFDSTKFKDYGKMARLNLSGLQAGKRVVSGEKKHKTDFALWKFSEKPGERQQEWNSPWGVGYPGWHIECSAMSMKYLGAHFDIHTGGEDHISIHHTNEITQSEAATGKKFVNYWLHGAFLTFKGEKVSKSKGGLYTIGELEEQGYDALDYRYLCLLTHYRKQLDFSLEALEAARNARMRLVRKVIELRASRAKDADCSALYEEKFLRAVNDDMNLPSALAFMWGAVNDEAFGAKKKLKLLVEFDKIFGLGIPTMKEENVVVPAAVRKMVDEREQARKVHDWTRADTLRVGVFEKGFVIEDSSDGPKISKK